MKKTNTGTYFPLYRKISCLEVSRLINNPNLMASWMIRKIQKESNIYQGSIIEVRMVSMTSSLLGDRCAKITLDIKLYGVPGHITQDVYVIAPGFKVPASIRQTAEETGLFLEQLRKPEPSRVYMNVWNAPAKDTYQLAETVEHDDPRNVQIKTLATGRGKLKFDPVYAPVVPSQLKFFTEKHRADNDWVMAALVKWGHKKYKDCKILDTSRRVVVDGGEFVKIHVGLARPEDNFKVVYFLDLYVFSETQRIPGEILPGEIHYPSEFKTVPSTGNTTPVGPFYEKLPYGFLWQGPDKNPRIRNELICRLGIGDGKHPLYGDYSVVNITGDMRSACYRVNLVCSKKGGSVTFNAELYLSPIKSIKTVQGVTDHGC